MADLTSLPDLLEPLTLGSNYVAPFLVLLLCGMGFPLPEEVTLIGSGLLWFRGEVEFLPITVVCALAILIGDSLPYWLGRHYGMAALRIRGVSRVLHPERFALLEDRFREHGNWVVFTCRFLPGIRIPGYFTAGLMKMTYRRFLALDTIGVLISVPTSIWLGKLFAESIDRLESRFEALHLFLAFAVLTTLLIVLVRERVRARDRQVRASQARDSDPD